MKLLDLTPYFHSKSGGIKKFILKKVEYLPKFGFEHVVVIPGEESKVYKLKNTKFYEVSSFPIPLSGGYRFFKRLEYVEDIIRKESPDIVELGGTYLISPFLKVEDSFLSIFYHSDAKREMSFIPSPKLIKDGAFKLLVDKCLSKADMILTPAKKYTQTLKEYGLKLVNTVHLGVDPRVFNPAKREAESFKERFGISKGKIVLLYVGRLSIDKGVNKLLKAFQLLSPKHFHLVLVGDGPLKAYVKRKAEKLGSITLIDYVNSEEDLAVIYASCDIFVNASTYETFGLAMLEAQSSGLPVAGFDLDLETQFLKETLSKEVSPQGLAQAIHRACELLSHSTREYLHTKAVEEFSWEKTFERYADLYSKIHVYA